MKALLGAVPKPDLCLKQEGAWGDSGEGVKKKKHDILRPQLHPPTWMQVPQTRRTYFSVTAVHSLTSMPRPHLHTNVPKQTNTNLIAHPHTCMQLNPMYTRTHAHRHNAHVHTRPCSHTQHASAPMHCARYCHRHMHDACKHTCSCKGHYLSLSLTHTLFHVFARFRVAAAHPCTCAIVTNMPAYMMQTDP